MSKVDVTTDAFGQGTFRLDGQDIAGAIQGFTVEVWARRTPQIRLNLDVQSTNITGEFDVMMTDQTADLLQRAGWTPPAGRVEAIAFKDDKLLEA